MNDIISKVTPLTRSIIWLHQGDFDSSSDAYKALDYLLNGLLTASLQSDPEANSQVILATNFHSALHVYITREIKKNEYESFLQLLKKDLTTENSILVIDEAGSYDSLIKQSPAEMKSQIHLLK